MKKRILTLLLALVLLVGTCTTALATNSSASDNQVNVEWVYDENGQCTWEVQCEIVEGVTDYWFKLVADYGSGNTSSVVLGMVSAEEGKNYVSFDFRPHDFYINASGKYQVIVYLDSTNSERYGATEYATYILPDKKLATTTGIIGEDKIFRFNTVEGAYLYEVEVSVCNSDNEAVGGGMTHDYYTVFPNELEKGTNGYDYQINVSESINAIGNKYGEKFGTIVNVRAISSNLNEYQSSDLGISNAYYVTFTTEEVKGSLNEITTLEDSLTYLDSVTTETLQTAMETDTEVVKKIAEIEKMYAEENEIVVSTTVEKNAQTLVDETKISMVGSALNAETENSTVELVVSVPEKSVDVADTYTNTVQLDISLLVNDTTVSELEVPITITMPVPNGVDTKNLTILHYHNETNPTVITPTVNTDGTISFTVSGFSTFVFANTVASDTTTNNSANTNDTTTIEKAPATGDTTSVYFLVLTMVLALGSIVVCIKCRSFAKTN